MSNIIDTKEQMAKDMLIKMARENAKHLQNGQAKDIALMGNAIGQLTEMVCMILGQDIISSTDLSKDIQQVMAKIEENKVTQPCKDFEEFKKQIREEHHNTDKEVADLREVLQKAEPVFAYVKEIKDTKKTIKQTFIRTVVPLIVAVGSGVFITLFTFIKLGVVQAVSP